jgi:hypothetical protein
MRKQSRKNSTNINESPLLDVCHAQRGARSVNGDSDAFLGTTAKYSANFPKETESTGEIVVSNPVYSPAVAAADRYRLQSNVRDLMPTSRTAKCLRWRQKDKTINVLKSKKSDSCHYSGLQTCGSVWSCPVCAAKVSERRRLELIKGMEAHKAAGGRVNMLTLTCPHTQHDNISDLLEKQAIALKYMFKDRSVVKVLKEMGKVGQIRALEVTHGRKGEQNNGWHPHYHILLFCGLGVDLSIFDDAQMRDWTVRLYLRWSACCVRAGLGEPSLEHGLKLDDGSKAASYVSKWGIENEMTKGHTKKASKGETPFDLLRAYSADSTDKQAGALFVEFAEAFRGKRQLHWSNGLKKLYDVVDFTDEELAAKIEEKSVVLGQISSSQWRDVLRVEGRALVLQLAAAGGWDAVENYLLSIKQKDIKIQR